MDLGQLLEGFYEIGFVHPFVPPSILSVSAFSCDRVGFYRKNVFAPEFGKMDQIWAENRFF